MARLPRWTRRVEVRLGVVALVLGALALFGDPTGGGALHVDPRDLAREAETGADRVAPQELAAWIVEGRSGYRLLDLRGDAALTGYRIPTAEVVRPTELEEYPIYRNERIVLYAADDLAAAEVWLLLRARGYRGAAVLDGGLEAWKERVLFPRLPEEATGAAALAAQRARLLAEALGGQAITGGAGSEDPTVALPEPPPPPVAAAVPGKRKRKEGC